MKRNINYKGLFWAGISFIGSGATLSLTLGNVGVGSSGVGFGLMAIGLSNRAEWKRKE